MAHYVFINFFFFLSWLFVNRIVIFTFLSAIDYYAARGVYRRSESRHMIMVALRYAKSPPILCQAFVLLKRFSS